MIRGLSLFLLGVVIGGGAMFAAFRWHFMQADDGWHWVRNSGSDLSECYTDVRGWTAREWSENPRLAAALVEGGEGDLIMRSSSNGLFDRLLDRR